MTENNDNKKLKQSKYKEPVHDFLEKHRFSEDSKDPPTHYSFGLFQGKFVLDKAANKELMKLYVEAIDRGVDDFSILEKQKEYAPIIVDIDLERPLEEDMDLNERLYDDELIDNIVEKYIASITKYLDVPELEKNKICIFEKGKPTEKESCLKDGFHIIFPDVCAHTKIRHLIRHNVVKMCVDEDTFEDYSNSADKIIDKAVVSSNGWFLYGSKKPSGQLYTLSKIYNCNMDMMYDNINKKSYNLETGEATDEDYNIETLIRYLSVHQSQYSKKYATPIKDEYVESDIDAECEKLGITSTIKSDQPKFEINASKDDEIKRAVKFTNMLSINRSDDYHDWLRVGLVLHNIDDSLVYTWIEFSKKSSKYKEGECEKSWKSMKNPANGNVLTIRSLAYWAKQDDPKQYEQFIKEEFKVMLRRSLDGNTYYLAKSVFSKYCDRFVCSSIGKNIWWEFRNHRWNRIEQGYTLLLLFSEDFANEYNKEIADISIQATRVTGLEKEELQQRRTRIDKIVEKLMNNTFKKTLLDECKSLFYDTTFEQKLDSNIHLLGFENGVYDLEQVMFRDGRPDDYITLSTKNDYHKWSEKNPYNKQLFSFFNQVLPNEKVRKYFLNALCTCLSGETKEEKLYIMTGSGSNGKSLTMDLMYMAFGDYYMSCPISIITRKRGQSNETSPEKVRMKGRRCGVFQEADDGEKINVGVMKEFTGGDKVLVRDLFKGANEMLEFKPQMKYFLTCNQLPPVPSNDDGTWRRLRVIEFLSKFTDNPTKPNEYMIDNTLKQKIESWAPTFISYMIHIFNTEYKNMSTLKEPDEVLTSTNQYKMENDFFTEYIMERLTVTTNTKNSINQMVMWNDFSSWYKSIYDPKTLPKKPELIKFLSKKLGDPIKSKFTCVTFNNDMQESDDEADNKPKNELDV
jgi:P4 family phage/plasmid primase-like protien